MFHVTHFQQEIPMSQLIASIDQGTTSTRCILFDRAGQIVASAQKEHQQIYPQPGWVEHDPLEIWQRTQEVIRLALAQTDTTPQAIGITNQRETAIVWDRRTGKPLHNAIVWQDTRTKGICDELAAAGGQDRLRAKTGLPLATYFAGPKVKWLLDNVPAVRQAAQRGDALFGTVDSWLVWNLTGGPNGGVHLTDVTNASRTLLMDLTTLDWDSDLLALMGIPRSMLPRIVESSAAEPWGYSLPEGPFGTAIPICGILGDQQAALVGQTCFSPGEAKNTYGTGCFMLMNTGNEIVPSRSGLLTTLGYKLGNQPAVYALEGSIAITGALVQWLRDNLGLIEKSADVESLANTVPDNGGVYFVPAFSGLFAPHWRSDARGIIAGLTRFANKGHIARAALEATAFQTREVLDAMRQDSGVALSSLKVDGGMVYNALLMQFQADLLGVPVVRPRIAETTALGAAYAAGLSVNTWTSLDDLRTNWQMDITWAPQMDALTRQNIYATWQKAVQRSLNWVD
jgi:glycerol kinase